MTTNGYLPSAGGRITVAIIVVPDDGMPTVSSRAPPWAQPCEAKTIDASSVTIRSFIDDPSWSWSADLQVRTHDQ